MAHTKLWIAFAAVLVVGFSVLGGVGYKVIESAPPIPREIVTTTGQTVVGPEEILDGQNVWQSLGGQQVGTVLGHGAYVAPDWTADYLHREALFLLDAWAVEAGAKKYALGTVEQQAVWRARLHRELRKNTYDPATGRIVVSPARAEAFTALAAYYADVFANGRTEYAIPRGALTDPAKAKAMTAFFWWTAWTAVTPRPGDTASYTNNWPADALVGNAPTPGAVMWSVISVILLLAGIGAMVWYIGAGREENRPTPPARDPFLGGTATPSQKAVLKYFLVVVALIVIQVALGGIIAHYGVEGDGFYGVKIDAILPYSIARTWHIQIGLFWIATSWLATGLYLAPIIGGREPRGQKLGVNLLFAALVLVVGGSLTGEWLGIKQRLGGLWFLFGAQGYEYVDLGRVWQIALFGGMVFWLWLMWHALKPALAKRDESRSLLLLFVVAAVAIPLFYGAGLMYGQRSHIVRVEYWRWWVVHLWVEGFFEVFATVVIAFLFTRLGLTSVRTATRAALFSTAIFLSGGIIGTFHHMYFTGTPEIVLALGGCFSAFEVVPLCLVGFEAWENIRHTRAAGWLAAYRFPILFFVAVAFWNFVGAGLFGFLINPPIALYYMQGLNLTPVHGHTALFGVYGMLGIGLTLFCLRAWRADRAWKTKAITISFWGLNAGLVLMVGLSMLPIGLLQAWASVEHGMWYARSAEFMQSDVITSLRWVRVLGDTVFAVGAVALAVFVVGLFRSKSSPEPVPSGRGVPAGSLAASARVALRD